MHVRFKKYVLRLVALMVIFGGTNSVADESAPDIFAFSSDLPKNQKRVVQKDLNFLTELTFNDSSGAGARLYGTPMDSVHLQKWLSDRSHYIVSENYKYEEHTKILATNSNYPNAGIDIYFEVPLTTKPKPLKGNQQVYVGMANIGSGIYRAGKRAKNLLSVDIPGIGAVTVNSPRTGIFKVGQGLFLPLLSDSDTWDSRGNSLKRLMMYFHEARHSDGNGKSLLFAHAPCPDNSTYAGFYGCDRNQNGPYTIGGTFLRSTVDTCSKCSQKEKEALRNLYADQFSRILTEGTFLNAPVSAAPVDSKADSCAALKNLNVTPLPQACSSQSAAQAPQSFPKTGPEPRPAWLDDAPEMIGATP
jgi:hypothetical protein